MKQNNLSYWQWGSIIGVLFLFFKLEIGIWNLWTADTLYANGQNLQKLNRYTESYESLKQAIELLPSEPIYQDEMAQLTANLALASVEKDATLSAQLAQISVLYSNNVIKASPQNFVFWKSRTRDLYFLSLLDKQYLPYALEAAKNATTLAPTDAKINYFYGLLLSLNEKGQEAVAQLEKTVAMKIDYRDARFQLAKTYLATGDKIKAKEHADFIIAKIGDDKEVKAWLEEQKL
jgi:tetratricopeptide (TPR) repeat protein